MLGWPNERRRGRGAFGGQVSSSLKRGAWNAQGKEFGGLGLDKWDYANVVALKPVDLRSKKRLFGSL